MKCSVPHCESDVIARQLCSKHYKRWQINGHTKLTNGKGCPDPKERFLLQTMRKGNGCLEWTGHIARNGYGQTKWNRKFFTAHRFAWTLMRGKIPKGKMVLHKCDNKACVDCDHLYLGDGSNNSADAVERGQIALGEKSCKAKLSDADVVMIRNSNEPPKLLAKRLGVHWATVYKIRKTIGRRYA